MRPLRSLEFSLVAVVLGGSPLAHAEPPVASVPAPSEPPSTPATPDTQTPEPTAVLAARRHFSNGVRLYQDANYSAALIEFEAADELKPGSASLQNIALCQKALFRYAAAADTLDRLLSMYGASMPAAERVVVEAAKHELESLTRHLRVSVTPAAAVVELDGEPLSLAERKAGRRVNVGEHRLSVTAPGYRTKLVPVRVASGPGMVELEIRLEPVAGFVTIVTEQKGAAIAVDGRALDYERWSGPLAPGDHVLQIYKAGHATVEEPFEVVLGEHKVIRASAGGELEESAVGSTSRSTNRGWYGMGAFNLMLVPDAPDGVRVDDSFNSGALSWGGRAGYRILDPLGVEVLIEGGRTQVTDACIEAEDSNKWKGVDASCDDASATLEYTITAFRLGGNLRLLSSGERARWTSTLGFGGVQHRFQLEEPSTDAFDAQALNAYVLVEIGVQFNLNRLLLEADFVTYVESRGSLDNGERDLFNEGGLKSFGLGIKAGWSEWKPD
ncbi:MAG TPA: hypothetical protein VFU02_23605 [Polyangiaceae bacterium]|nr:hypothetical protein [Polyangiaceae bacterium]